VQVIDGINRCLPELPRHVRVERNVMASNLLMHTCADGERALAAGTFVPGPRGRPPPPGSSTRSWGFGRRPSVERSNR
jgi:hypothetical protein